MSKLTEQQRKILVIVIDLLTPLCANVKISHEIKFYRDENGSEEFSDHDTCSDQACENSAKKAIVKMMGKENKGKAIVWDKDLDDVPENTLVYTTVWTDNDGDHEKMEMCSVCGKYLNESLTWIENEFEHHSENSTTKEDIEDPNTTFELLTMFNSMPSCDYSRWIDGVNKDQKQQDDFFNKVIEYAQTVIDILSGKDINNG